MQNVSGTTMSEAEFQTELAAAPEQLFAVAGDEGLLSRLPRGNWIGGTIPYMMTEQGGLTTRELVFVQRLPSDEGAAPRVSTYDAKTIARITEDAPDNGYTLLLIPAFSEVHLAYGKDAPGFKDLFSHPIVGWITGIHLSDLGKTKPKVFNGRTGEAYADWALACHVPLPEGKAAVVEIVNIFEPVEGPDIRFPTDGFAVTDCTIDGRKTNFARWLTEQRADTQLPLISDYNGARVNVSIQAVDPEAGQVSLYAPVFRDRTYRLAKPMPDYVQAFQTTVGSPSGEVPFACNCTLNFLYGKLEGARAGLPGPCTFGEIAYQLLNQTTVFFDVADVTPGEERRISRGVAQRMALAR